MTQLVPKASLRYSRRKKPKTAGPVTQGARFASSLAAWRGAGDRRVEAARARHGPDVR